MIWVDWHLGQFIDLTEIIQGSDLKFTIIMHYYPLIILIALAMTSAWLKGKKTQLQAQ